MAHEFSLKIHPASIKLIKIESGKTNIQATATITIVTKPSVPELERVAERGKRRIGTGKTSLKT